MKRDFILLDGEELRPIAGLSTYLISNLGRVCSLALGQRRIKRHALGSDGYCRINLNPSPGKTVTRYVHILTAEAFLPPRPSEAHEVNHKDGNKQNNRAENLEWVTRSENLLKAYQDGGYGWTEKKKAFHARRRKALAKPIWKLGETSIVEVFTCLTSASRSIVGPNGDPQSVAGNILKASRRNGCARAYNCLWFDNEKEAKAMADSAKRMSNSLLCS